MRLAKRTGATKAKVALVRKLAVSLHRLWRDGRNDATAHPAGSVGACQSRPTPLATLEGRSAQRHHGWTVFQVRDPDYEPPAYGLFSAGRSRSGGRRPDLRYLPKVALAARHAMSSRDSAFPVVVLGLGFIRAHGKARIGNLFPDSPTQAKKGGT